MSTPPCEWLHHYGYAYSYTVKQQIAISSKAFGGEQCCTPLTHHRSTITRDSGVSFETATPTSLITVQYCESLEKNNRFSVCRLIYLDPLSANRVPVTFAVKARDTGSKGQTRTCGETMLESVLTATMMSMIFHERWSWTEVIIEL